MKKRMLLIVLLLILAALDVIGTDELKLRAGNISENDGTSDSGTDIQQENSVKNDGIPPKTIGAIIREELNLFPIPHSLTHPEYRASFEDSWMSARTFGGDRGHEGTDIMLSPDERGLFPVLSMTDGFVEKKGWLPQGGYRIGVRSDGGIYYYYAHLYDYADDLEEGTAVTAGQLLGFAGDTGYSNIEGTVGNFPVHLHVGIYYNDVSGSERAVDPYAFLLSLPIVTLEY